jgi:hydroxymethylbilane synthase
VVGGDCSFPVGAYASPNGRGSMTITGMIASPDGVTLLKKSMTASDEESLGRDLAEEMLSLGGSVILRGSAI